MLVWDGLMEASSLGREGRRLVAVHSGEQQEVHLQEQDRPRGDGPRKTTIENVLHAL
jgi:hypothetical protein